MNYTSSNLEYEDDYRMEVMSGLSHDPLHSDMDIVSSPSNSYSFSYDYDRSEVDKIIYFINISDREFIYEPYICQTNTVMPYELIYIKWNSNGPNKFLKIHFNFEIVIYAEVNKSLDRDRLEYMISEFKKKGLHKYITIFNNTNMYRDEDRMLQLLKMDIFKEKTLLYKKFLNIVYSETISGDYRKIDTTNYPKILIRRVYTNSITCQPWFKYYLSTIFDCTRGKVFQKSSTCYINAVINGFIVDKTLRSIIFDKIKRRDDIDIIKSDILSCTKEPIDDTYFYQLFYNSLCKKIHDKNIDIMQKYEEFLLGEFRHRPDVSRLLERICKWIFKYVNNFVYYREDIQDKYSFNSGTKCIILRFDDVDKIPKGIIHNNTGKHYDLVFGVIVIGSFESDQGVFSHAVTGFICDGLFKITDSNRYTYNIDWTDIDINLYNTISEPYESSKVGSPLIYVDCALYMDREYKSNVPYVNIDGMCQSI